MKRISGRNCTIIADDGSGREEEWQRDALIQHRL